MKYAIVALMLVLSLSACKKSAEKMVVGKWKLTEMTSPELTDEAAKKEFYEKVTLSILKDGDYAFAGLPKPNKGKWELSEDGKTFTTTDSDGKIDKANVLELSEVKLSVVMGADKMSFERVKDK